MQPPMLQPASLLLCSCFLCPVLLTLSRLLHRAAARGLLSARPAKVFFFFVHFRLILRAQIFFFVHFHPFLRAQRFFFVVHFHLFLRAQIFLFLCLLPSLLA